MRNGKQKELRMKWGTGRKRSDNKKIRVRTRTRKEIRFVKAKSRKKKYSDGGNTQKIGSLVGRLFLRGNFPGGGKLPKA